jgi:tRNA modification GTPase
LPLRQIAFGRWTTGEELVVCRVDHDQIEIHCHGGTAAVETIVDTLQSSGAVRQTAEDWAQVHGGDLVQAEARLAFAESKTERTALILLDQYCGALRREVETLIRRLNDKSDYLDAIAYRLSIVRKRAELGLHLTRYWRVAIIGPPNVGKSSLVNALVGYQRSIVFDQPGTTRDAITVETALDGWPVQLIDTAGLRETADAIEGEGVQKALHSAEQADVIVVVREVDECPECLADDYSFLPNRPIVVINKMDLRPVWLEGNGVIDVSAKTGQGLEDLIKAIVVALVGRPPEWGAAIPFTPRQAEFVRKAESEIAAGRVSDAVSTLRELLGSPSVSRQSAIFAAARLKL